MTDSKTDSIDELIYIVFSYRRRFYNIQFVPIQYWTT